MPAYNDVGRVGGQTQRTVTAMRRPSNTTAYTAGDAVSKSTSVTFTNPVAAARTPGGGGYITSAKIQTDQVGCTARFRVHFFQKSENTLTGVPLDNAAFILKYADAPYYLGNITFPACATEQSGSDMAFARLDNIMMGFVADTNDQNIYFQIETLDGFTPASAQNFILDMIVEDN